jgi:hypothetical protein
MELLNCRVGDLAVTVTAALPENVGKIVRVVGSHGMDTWWGFDQPTHLWEVVTVEGTFLVYEDAWGVREFVQGGRVPDAFIRPLTRLTQPLTSWEVEDAHV